MLSTLFGERGSNNSVFFGKVGGGEIHVVFHIWIEIITVEWNSFVQVSPTVSITNSLCYMSNWVYQDKEIKAYMTWPLGFENQYQSFISYFAILEI